MLATRARVGILLGLGAAGLAALFAGRWDPPPEPARVAKLTADDILEASMRAQGGRDAFARIPALDWRGTITDLDDNEAAPGELRESANTMHFVVHWSSGVYRSDVEAGVTTEDVGIDHRVLTGDEREQVLLDAVFPYDPSWRRAFARADFVGVDHAFGEPAYMIRLTSASGLTRMLHISKETLLPLAAERDAVIERASWEPAGPPHEEHLIIRYDDYRDVRGVLMPFQWRWEGTDDHYLPPVVFRAERCRVVETALR